MRDFKYIDNQIKWLKRYIDSETKSLQRAVDKVERTNKEAVDKVEENNKDKFAGQNEWRQQYKDQTESLASKTDLETVKNQISSFVTRRELWAAVVTIVTLLISLAVYVSKK